MSAKSFERPARLLAIAVLLAASWSSPPRAAATTPSAAQLIGQKLVVAMSGTTPDAAILGRIQRGEIGGVILFGDNIVDASQVRALTNKLRAAAAAGGQPALLITTDQEGGAIKRVPWAPPTLTVAQMAAAGTARAYAQAKSSATMLRCAGLNSDLAPVADVPSSSSSFMEQQGRTWSSSASVTASLANAFAAGLTAGGNVPAMKHFPGIGMATQNTDTHDVVITASQSALAPGLVPYQQAIAAGIPMIMLSNATYTAYDTTNAASWSHAIAVDLLRTKLGFTGVTITDSLSGTAAARGVSATSLAVKAAKAGADMILLTGSEASTASTYAALVQDVGNGTISRATLQASYDRILALKATLKAPPSDSTPPSVSAPGSRLLAGTTLGSTAVVRTTSSVSDPCGISSRVLERRINGGAWVAEPLAAGTSITRTDSLAIGEQDRYVARATDGAGNLGPWHYGSTFAVRLTQQSSSTVRYAGSWVAIGNAYASGGSLRYSTAAGASATFTFTGRSVAWVSFRSPVRGSAKVYIDGVYKATVNLYASTFSARDVVYAANWSVDGPHTLRIVNAGTAGHSRVDIDAFLTLAAP